jgi:hypothetical protein
MDYFEILLNAAKISWKQKRLWLFGMMLCLPFLLMMLIFWLFYYLSTQLILPGAAAKMEIILSAGGWIALPVVVFSFSILVVLLSFASSAIGMTGPTLGVIHIDQGKGISFRRLFKDCLPFFWRVLGLIFLISAGEMVIMMIMEGIMMFITLVTFGLGVFLMMPLMFLFLMIMMILYAYQELCLMSIIVEDRQIVDALHQGWGLLKKNFWSVSLVSLLIFLASWLASMVMITPIVLVMSIFSFLPVFLTTTGYLMPDALGKWTIVLSGTSMIVFLPLVMVYLGWSLSFFQASWTRVFNCLPRAVPSVS